MSLRNLLSDPIVVPEATFNITNKLSFVKNGAGYEIEYNISPHGVGIFENLSAETEKKILPNPLIKATPAAKSVRQIFPKFENIGKQNLKV